MVTVVRPKESKGALEPVTNTFAVQNGMLWDYYPIKLGDRKGDYVAIVKLPPVLKEGYATYQKKLFKVTFKDFLRSRVNVGQPAYTAEPGTDDESGSTEQPKLVTVKPAVNSEQCRTDDTFGVQINEAADVAWQEQVRALLYLDDPEAEWEFETAPQS